MRILANVRRDTRRKAAELSHRHSAEQTRNPRERREQNPQVRPPARLDAGAEKSQSTKRKPENRTRQRSGANLRRRRRHAKRAAGIKPIGGGGGGCRNYPRSIRECRTVAAAALRRRRAANRLRGELDGTNERTSG